MRTLGSKKLDDSPSIELKRFSRLDLAEAVSAVMQSDTLQSDEDDHKSQWHRRGQMAKQLSSIHGLISGMGYDDHDPGSTDDSKEQEHSAYDALWGSPALSGSRHFASEDHATPRALHNIGDGHSTDLSIYSESQSSAIGAAPASSNRSPVQRSIGEPVLSTKTHHRRPSSAYGHRKSAREDFNPSRKALVHLVDSGTAPSDRLHIAPGLVEVRPVQLRHHRSTSSIDRSHYRSTSASAMRPPPMPSIQRRETFDVAAVGISSLQDEDVHSRSSKTWRASIADDAQFDSLMHTYGKKEMRRQELIWELCETENAFIADMQLVLRRFAQPLRTPQGRWIDGIDPDVTRLFDWLEDIAQIHLGIQEKLQAMQAEQVPLTLQFATAFKPCVSHLTIHLPYLVRFESVSRKLESLVRNPDSEIGEFVRMQTAALECRSMSLVSYLLKPVQRLMRYPLFFKQIRDLTPPAHIDHAPTLSLLHATDAVIRIMQEVKAREEELESLRQLETRIKGLPPGFTLSHRERHLLHQGVLHRVMLSERDQMRLTAYQEPRESFQSSAKSRATSETSRMSTSTGYTAASPLLSPYVEYGTRPDSMFSEASTAESALAPSTRSSDSAHTDLRASSLFRRPSMASSESSFADSRRPSTANLPSLPHELNKEDRPEAKAKEVPLYLFVFSDIVLIASQTSERAGLLGGRRGSTAKDKTFQVTYKLVESCGIGRALTVKDWSERLGHSYLLELDLLNMQVSPAVPSKTKKQPPASSAPIASPTANTVFLTLPDRSFAKMVIAPQNNIQQSYGRWLDALQRSCMTSHHTLSTSGSLTDLISPGGIGTIGGTPNPDVISPKKGSKGAQMVSSSSQYSLEEREEREWWARRYNAVKEEMGRMPTVR